MAYRPMEKTPNPYGTVRSVPYAGADSLKHQPKIPNGRQWRELIHKHETLAPPPGSRGEEGDGAVTVPACMVQCGVNEPTWMIRKIVIRSVGTLNNNVV
jgi:hypothetical protein